MVTVTHYLLLNSADMARQRRAVPLFSAMDIMILAKMGFGLCSGDIGSQQAQPEAAGRRVFLFFCELRFSASLHVDGSRL